MTSPADGDPAADADPAGPGDTTPSPGSPSSSPTAGSGPTAAPGHDPVRSHATSAAAQITGGDWPAQAADRIVEVVDTVRNKTTGPVQTAARGAVYGLVAAILAVVVVVLLIIFAIRVLAVLVDEFIPWGGIWLPYLILGVIFLIAGSLLFRRRRQAPA